MKTDYALWLQERQKGIGGSDVPALLGLCPWSTRLELYHSKVDPIPDDTERESPHESDRAMRFWAGRILEEPVASLFRLDHGLEVLRPGGAPRIRGIFRGNPDRLVYTEEKYTVPLEIKTTSRYNWTNWGDSGTEQVPAHVAAQTMHYMMLLDAPYGFVAILIGGQQYRWFKLYRSERLERIIVQAGEHFWRDHVEPQIPPEPDYRHPSTLDYLKALYNTVDAEADVVTLDEQIWAAHVRKKDVNAQIRALEKERDEATARIRAAMKDAPFGRFPDGMIFPDGKLAPAGCGYRAKMIDGRHVEYDRAGYMDVRFVNRLPI